MKYFSTYSSGTLAASGSQYHFTTDLPQTGRIYYKIFASGTYNWSILFSNIMDSTFADGSISHANLLGGQWEILSAGVCISNKPDPSDVHNIITPITFCGNTQKNVMPGEYFVTDPISITAEKGQYLCLEMTYRGEMIPHHPETCVSSYIKTDDSWALNTAVPFPSHLGCDRKAKIKIGYLGDSITQGCGTARDSYSNWSAVLSEMIGEDNSYWNLGLGYARGADAATDSSWLYKAKQVDVISVCFGVNDLLNGRSAEQIKTDITSVVRYLRKAECKVLLQTVPPFDYTDTITESWNNVNDYIRDVLSKEADAFFDNNPILSETSEHPEKTRYGGHPDAEGCKAWAEALYPVMKEFLEKI